MGWPACISHVVSVGAVYDANLGGVYGWCVAASSCATKEPNAGCSTGFASWETPYADHVTAYSNSASFLTLFAPSNDAYTTTILGRGNDSTKNYDTDFGGTSAACPYAAGAAAVLQSAAKAKTGVHLTPSKVKELLTVNGDAITDGKVAITKPRINLTNAVNAITPSSFCGPCLPSMGGWRATLQ
jgi:subtilisin family serine protease